MNSVYKAFIFHPCKQRTGNEASSLANTSHKTATTECQPTISSDNKHYYWAGVEWYSGLAATSVWEF